MIWLLVLHIMALLFWAASLLYLPLLLAATGARQADLVDDSRASDSVARIVFTHLATPAALIAIVTGTAVFLIGRTVEYWLILKLTAVTLLVISHVGTGLLVRRAEVDAAAPTIRACGALTVVLCLIMAAIVWIVLAKPPVPEDWPWGL